MIAKGEPQVFSDFIAFIDESGDHSLESIDPEYPLFVLAFCLMRKEVFVDVLTPRIRKLKFKTFGHDKVILHEHDIRKRTGAFAKLGRDARDAFMSELTETVREVDFKLFAVVIDKQRHKERYIHPAHPYHMAMQFGLERIFGFLRLHGQHERPTFLVCEARGSKEDKDLELEFRRVRDGANYQGIRLPFELIIADKRINCEGLQMADLTARPIGLSVLRPEQPNRAMEVLEGKFSRGATGRKEGIGLKVFP